MSAYLKQSVFFLLFAGAAQAINVGVLTTEIQDKETFVIKEIKNQEAIAKFVTTKVVEIDNPKSLNAIVGGAPQILISPATLLVSPGKTANIKIYYQGPKDGKERYYQLVFVEQNMSKTTQLKEGASLQANQKISIATVLVVRPRVMNFSYKTDGKGQISNTGNTFIQAVAIGHCAEKESSKTTPCTLEDFILPGKNADFTKSFKKFDGYGIWQGLKYDYIPANS